MNVSYSILKYNVFGLSVVELFYQFHLSWSYILYSRSTWGTILRDSSSVIKKSSERFLRIKDSTFLKSVWV